MKQANYEVSTKIEKLDLEFILNNFLNPKLWDKDWKIFEWNGVVVNVSISNINVKSGTISLRTHVDLQGYFRKRNIQVWSWTDSNTVDIPYKLEHRNIELFENQIFNSAVRGMDTVEYRIIINTDDYNSASHSEHVYRKGVEKIANDFLDEENVTHEAIREAYVEKYVDDAEIPNMTGEVVDLYRHTFIGKILVMLALFFNNKNGKEKFSRYIKQNNLKLGALRKEVKRLQDLVETAEFEEEQKERLVAIHG